MLLSIPVRLEILNNLSIKIYFQCDTEKFHLCLLSELFKLEMYQQKYHMFLIVVNGVLCDNKIEEEDWSGEDCQVLSGE